MEISQAEKAKAFARLHEGPQPFVIPNPWDAGSARILAGLGFKALATTSAGMAFALGRTDGAVSRDEALAHVRAIVDATPLPVSGDLENGYGDAPKPSPRPFAWPPKLGWPAHRSRTPRAIPCTRSMTTTWPLSAWRRRSRRPGHSTFRLP